MQPQQISKNDFCDCQDQLKLRIHLIKVYQEISGSNRICIPDGIPFMDLMQKDPIRWDHQRSGKSNRFRKIPCWG